MAITPVGKKKEAYKVEKPKTYSEEELLKMPLDDAKPYLRGFPKKNGERFPWILVERCINEPGYQEKQIFWKERIEIELEEPNDGYKWFWVDDMCFLSGYGGLLEVDVKNKKQGRFVMGCIS